jgi:uncharacterized protein GlcG (DUF336 family)
MMHAARWSGVDSSRGRCRLGSTSEHRGSAIGQRGWKRHPDGTRTGDFTESTQPGGGDWGWNTTDERIVVYAGGIPLLADGKLVGGLGASGGAADEDEACVVAAAQAVGLA